MTETIQNALAYIEANLTEELDIRDIAKQAALSPYYFQRIFSALCGVGVGEYIRSRRLALAGEELSRTNARVIDIAAKYGYDSPDSFARAFQRFHGVTPSGPERTVPCSAPLLRWRFRIKRRSIRWNTGSRQRLHLRWWV